MRRLIKKADFFFLCVFTSNLYIKKKFSLVQLTCCADGSFIFIPFYRVVPFPLVTALATLIYAVRKALGAAGDE